MFLFVLLRAHFFNALIETQYGRLIARFEMRHLEFNMVLYRHVCEHIPVYAYAELNELLVASF